MSRLFLLSGAVFGFLSVALGAFGAHSLKPFLDAYGQDIWEKAVLYQMFHTVALFITGLLQQHFKNLNFAVSGYAFIAGIILFSGSLYVLALSKISMLGLITPFGGVAFLVGWFFMAYRLTRI